MKVNNPAVTFDTFSAEGCIDPVNIICGGGMTPTVPVTASSERHILKNAANQACLDNQPVNGNSGKCE